MSFLHGSRGATRFGWCVAAAMVLAGCGLSVDGVALRTRVSHDGATAGDTLVTQDDRGTPTDERSVDAVTSDGADGGPAPDVIEGEVVSLDVIETGGDDAGADTSDVSADAGDDALASDASDAAEVDAACSGDSECPGGHCSAGTCVYDAGAPIDASVDVPVAMDAADASIDVPDAVAPTDGAADADAEPPCTAPCPVRNGFRACVGGACSPTIVCSLGFGNCNGVAADGCETTTLVDESNCGGCGLVCPAGQLCAGGTCGGACRAAGQTECTTPMGTACFDLQADPRHCGSCDTACPTGQTCSGGMCQCPLGATLCGSVCVNTQSNASNCGACGVHCDGGSVCRDGACTCAVGQLACRDGTSFTCVNPLNNAQHCGACGVACAAPTTACIMGMCACSDANKMPCGGACVARNDMNNCGACGNVCPMNTVCTTSSGGGGATFGCRCASGVTCEGVCALSGTFTTCPSGIVCRTGRCPVNVSSMRCAGDVSPCALAAAGG